jgi:sugar fermentation stimulation protein A
MARPHDKYEVAQYRDRQNRFLMRVKRDDGTVVEAYCPNTSRLIGLLEGSPDVLLTRNSRSDRKTNFTIRAFRNNGVWVGIEAVRANDLFEDFLQSTSEAPFAEWDEWEREVSYRSSQLDFRRGLNGEEWVEVKSLSSRTDEGKAFYSGTPSERGYRHLDHLGDLVDAGRIARCVFVVQREDVDAVAPADQTEPDWLNALRKAESRGVDIRAYRCKFSGETWTIRDEIPAYL